MAIVQSAAVKNQVDAIFAADGVFGKTLICGEDNYISYIKDSSEDFDVIFACSSAYEAAAAAASVPVIPMRASFQDILRAILMSASCSSSAAFVGDAAECSQALDICELLQSAMPVVRAEAPDLGAELERLRENGCGMVIAGEAAASLAQEYGLESITVTVGAKTIEELICQAKRIAGAAAAVRQRLGLIESALSSSDFLTVLLDEAGNILYFSRSAADYSQLLSYIHTQQVSKLAKKQVVKLNSNYWSIEKHNLYTPFGPAVCLYIQQQNYDLEDIAMRGIMIATHSDLTKHGISESYLSSCESTHDIVNDTRNYAKLPSPVLIYGEPGVGKNSFANIIHKYSPYRENHVVVVDCELVDLPTWAKLLHEPESVLTETDVVYFFKNFEQVPAQLQNTLIRYLRSMNDRGRCKFVVSCNCSGTALPGLPSIAYLTDNLRASRIYVPPLRDRLNELNSLCSILVSSLSVELGSQVIGLEPNAVAALKEYRWPGNLNQLRRFLAEQIVSTKGYYISAATVSAELQREAANTSAPALFGTPRLDLSGSLDEIEKRILLQVLNEEGQNQTSAAKRLGISRSTFWRKLKS